MAASLDQDREKYVAALEKLKGRDRVGWAAEVAATGASAATGFAMSGAVASAFGASTLLGSSTLGTLLGGVFVTATPIGWVVGSALAAGAVGLGIARCCRSGGANDEIRRQTAAELRKRMDRVEKAGAHTYDELLTGLQAAVSTRQLEPVDAERLLRLVNEGRLKLDVAVERIQALNRAASQRAERA